MMKRGFVALTSLCALLAAISAPAACWGAPIGRIVDGLGKSVFVGMDLAADQTYEEMARTRLEVNNGILDAQDVAAAKKKLGPLQAQVADLIAAKRLMLVAYNTEALLVNTANPLSVDSIGSNPYCQVRLLSGAHKDMIVWTQHYEDFTPVVGETCYVAINGSRFAPSAVDSSSLIRFMKAADEGDNPTADGLIKAKKIVALKNKIKCSVLASSDESEDDQIRVLEGLYKNKLFWVPARFLTTLTPTSANVKKQPPVTSRKPLPTPPSVTKPIVIPAAAPGH